jgi:WhiB family redox-sensing transcriptional regulator
MSAGSPADDLSWKDLGRCRDAPSYLFYLERHLEAFIVAQKYCTDCEVKNQCLRYALEHQELGVWGGTTEHQRRKMLTEMGRVPRRELGGRRWETESDLLPP